MARGKRNDPRSLRQRGNVWFINKRLSPTLQKHFGKKNLSQSTKTGDFDEACQVRDRLLADLADLEAQLKGEASPTQQRRRFISLREHFREADNSIISAETVDQVSLLDTMDPEKLPEIEQEALRSLYSGKTPTQYRLSLRAALEDWESSPVLDRRHSTKAKNRLAVERLLAYLEADDVPLDSLGRRQAKGFINAMVTEGKTKQTVANYLTGLSAIWVHAEDSAEENTEVPNPFRGHRLQAKSKVQSYEQFTRADVEAIFGATEQSEGIYYLLPRLGFYTGARIDELCSLEVSDVVQRQGIWCLAIRKGKNQNAIREVPLHPEIENQTLGQLELAKTEGSAYLFPEAGASQRKDGKRGPKFSQWFTRLSNQVIDKRGRKLGFHSFRTTAITIMGDAGQREEIVVWITGHERGQTTANKVYHRGPTYRTRLKAIQTISPEALL